MKHAVPFVSLTLLFIVAGCIVFRKDAAPQNANIVFIGDSITSGYLMKFPERDAPPVRAAAWLNTQFGITNVLFRNCGKPGYRTDQFLPGHPNSAWNEVKRAGESVQKIPGKLVFSVMLGANDSAGYNDTAIHPPERFRADMRDLVEALCVSFPDSVIVIHHPMGYTKAPGTCPENLARYKGEIDSLVAEMSKPYPGRVFLGDVKAWAFFDDNRETHWFKEKRGSVPYYIHPNERGAQAIGQLWGEAIARALGMVSLEVGVKKVMEDK